MPNAAHVAPNDPTPQPDKSTSDKWLRKQFKWDEVEHLIKEGRILSLVYDTETTDLNHTFAAMTQFSGKVVANGKIIDELKLDIRVPEDVVVSPQAAVVTQSKPKELYSESRVPPHIAAGKIMLFFRNPYRALWDQLEDHKLTIKTGKKKVEEVRVYTIESEDHTKKAEIRLHQGGKFLSYQYPDADNREDTAGTYRDTDGARWKKIASPAMTEGYNNRRFDDRIIWSFLHRSMSDEIFLTHTKKFRRFRVDTMDVAKLVALLDEGRENGFKTIKVKNKETNTEYNSFKLSDLMEVNTRQAKPEVGIEEGIRMPDDSIYDRDKAHADAAYDVDATIALKAYLRKCAPDVVKSIEINSDFDLIKPFLMTAPNDKDFPTQPVLAFARTIFPDQASLHFGVCAGINEQIEERRQAVMIRTDTDVPLEKLTCMVGGKQKKLLKMTVEDLASVLEKQQKKPDASALFEIVDMRKNPPIIPAEMAYDHGKGAGDRETHEANRRFVIAHPEFCKKLLKAHSMAMQPMMDHKTIVNPQAEEHLFTSIAQPKRYKVDMGNGKTELLAESVHAEWVKALRKNRALDSVLRRAIKPQAIEFENRVDTLEAFIERMKAVKKSLKKYCGKTLPEPDQSFEPPKWDVRPSKGNPGVPHEVTEDECETLTANAREYLWKLRAELMYDFRDNTTRFTVQENTGSKEAPQWQDVSFQELNKMEKTNPGDLSNNIRTGKYRIDMEELGWDTELVARMFRDANKVEWVKQYWATREDILPEERDRHVQAWKAWEEDFAALRALRINGAPHLDVEDQRWMTANKALKEIIRLEKNFRSSTDLPAEERDWGGRDIYVSGKHAAQAILSEHKTLATSQLAQNPRTPQNQILAGYNPDDGYPIDHAPYEVPAGAKKLIIDVPDNMIDKYAKENQRLEPNFLSHHNVASKFIMVAPNDEQRRDLAKADKNTYLFLRGQQTGRVWLAAKPQVLGRNKIAWDDNYYNEVFTAAAKRFKDSGMMPPAAKDLVPISVEAIEPVSSKHIDTSVQGIQVHDWDKFIATVSPAMGNRGVGAPPLTGFVFKKNSEIVPEPGPVRLLGMVKDHHKNVQTESGWELPATIKKDGVRTITLTDAQALIDIGRNQQKFAIALVKAGHEQMTAAADQGKDLIEALRAALDSRSVTDAQLEEAGLKNLESLQKLMDKKSFTPRDADHYGFASLDEMKRELTVMFVDKKLSKSSPNNLIHFVDIEPAEKSKMSWHQPGRRQMVRVFDDVEPSVNTGADASWGKAMEEDRGKADSTKPLPPRP